MIDGGGGCSMGTNENDGTNSFASAERPVDVVILHTDCRKKKRSVRDVENRYFMDQ